MIEQNGVYIREYKEKIFHILQYSYSHRVSILWAWCLPDRMPWILCKDFCMSGVQ